MCEALREPWTHTGPSVDPENASYLEPEIRVGADQLLHYDFPFESLDKQPKCVKELARVETLRALGAVVDWLIDEQERERESSIAYRCVALAAVLRRPFRDGKTIDALAKEHRLNRVVLHRHMSLFAREFRLKPMLRKHEKTDPNGSGADRHGLHD